MRKKMRQTVSSQVAALINENFTKKPFSVKDLQKKAPHLKDEESAVQSSIQNWLKKGALESTFNMNRKRSEPKYFYSVVPSKWRGLQILDHRDEPGHRGASTKWKPGEKKVVGASTSSLTKEVKTPSVPMEPTLTSVILLMTKALGIAEEALRYAERVAIIEHMLKEELGMDLTEIRLKDIVEKGEDNPLH